MIAHHVGCVVENMQDGLKHYQFLDTTISEVYNITDQKVNVCFVKLPLEHDNYYLELVEPHHDNIQLKKILDNRIGFYHIAFKVDKIENWIEKLEKDDYRLITEFFSEAFMYKKCAFFMNPLFHLIEMIEQ